MLAKRKGWMVRGMSVALIGALQLGGCGDDKNSETTDSGGSTTAPTTGATTGGSTGGTTGGTAPPPAQRRTWSGAPGLVTAECRSAAVSLVAAQPSNGYQVEVEERGPARLLIQFEGTTDGHEGQTIVSARCVGGSPSFSVTRGDD